MNEIQRISSLDKNTFYRNYVDRNKPVIITDVVSSWQAFDTWTIDFFAQKYGHIKAGVMHLKNGQSNADTYNESAAAAVSVLEIIKSVQLGLTSAQIVLASTTAVFQPWLDNDIETPIYCQNGNFFRSRIYIGPQGLVTPLHHDLPENLYAVVKGGKHITLYRPSDRKYLYPNSLFSKHPNFARFNPDNPSYHLFPLATKAKPVEVFLNEGELLYMPSLWWHHIRNTKDSMAINFWWSVGWKTVVALGAATYKNVFHQQ